MGLLDIEYFIDKEGWVYCFIIFWVFIIENGKFK